MEMLKLKELVIATGPCGGLIVETGMLRHGLIVDRFPAFRQACVTHCLKISPAASASTCQGQPG